MSEQGSTVRKFLEGASESRLSSKSIKSKDRKSNERKMTSKSGLGEQNQVEASMPKLNEQAVTIDSHDANVDSLGHEK